MPGMVHRPGVQALGPFVAGQSRWPEGSHYRYHRGGHELVRVVSGVGGAQVAAVSRGEAEFALVLEEPLIVVCARFGDALPWLGGAFHWQDVPRVERGLPATGACPGDGAPLNVSLVEATDGRVHASRSVALSPEFARVLHEAILEQARFPFDPIAERRARDGLRRHYPCAGALVARATVRCCCPPEE